ncbi:WcaA Glycosyltransferases involved in cell wall biogenesis [Candidatus Nanopelagicaceae bacterium]
MISSLIAQSFKEWTLLVYDNNSDDGTSEIIRDFVETDSRIFTYYDQNLVNAAENLQRALEYGLAKFNSRAIFVIGGDDECEDREFLQFSLNHIESGASLVVPNYKMIDSQNRELHNPKESNKLFGFSSINWVNRLVHSIYPEYGNIIYAVYTRSLLESVVFSTRGKMTADSKRKNNLNFISDWWFIDTCLRNSSGEVLICREMVYVKFMKNIEYSSSYYFPEESSTALHKSSEVKSKYLVYAENLVLFPILTLLYERKRIKLDEYPFMMIQAFFMVGSRIFTAIQKRLHVGKFVNIKS